MHVIALRTILAFILDHPDAAASLLTWHREAERQRWATFAEVRQSFGSADRVGQFVVFNIAGNKYRLIAHIHHNRNRCYIERILTHEEYDQWSRSQR